MSRNDFFNKYGISLVLILLCVFFSLKADTFMTVSNIMIVARQISMMGIASIGMLFVLLTGGIDLSVGSMIGFINIVCAGMIVYFDINPVIAAILSILIGIGIGLLNGLAITALKIPPLITTLASMTILAGAALLMSGGMPIHGFKGLSFIGQGYIGFIPFPVILMAAVMAFGAFILSKTYFGRYFYAIGGNEEASILSGIDVVKIKLLVYSISGGLSAFAGVIMLSRLGSGYAITGHGFEFEVVTACVLGGVSIAGGSGRIFGVIIGVLIMGVLTNGLLQIGVLEYMQQVVQGFVLIAAVGYDCMSKYKATERSNELKIEKL
jgi:ribose transport system permease protein